MGNALECFVFHRLEAGKTALHGRAPYVKTDIAGDVAEWLKAAVC